MTSVGWGETLKTKQGSKLTLEIAVTDPEEMNACGKKPSLNRVDVIMGAVTGRQANADLAQNPSTAVVERVSRNAFEGGDGQYLIRTELTADANGYLRLRGTNTNSLEPRKTHWARILGRIFGSTVILCLSSSSTNMPSR